MKVKKSTSIRKQIIQQVQKFQELSNDFEYVYQDYSKLWKSPELTQF